MGEWRTWRRRSHWTAFWDGVASVFGVYGARSKTAAIRRMTAVDDAKALEGDWKQVGDDLKAAIAGETGPENSHKRDGEL